MKLNRTFITITFLLACLVILHSVYIQTQNRIVPFSVPSMQKLQTSSLNGQIFQAKSKNKNFVIFSADDEPSGEYLFFAPLTTIIWKTLMNYEPICIIVHKSDKNSKVSKMISFVESKIKEAGGIPILIPIPSHNVEKPTNEKNQQHKLGLRLSTVSQVIRLFAAALDFIKEEDYVLTSDVDIWPLDYFYFEPPKQKNDAKTSFFSVLYSNIYTREEAMYPICYLGAEKSTWKSIMEIPSSKTLKNEQLLKELTIQALETGKKQSKGWENREKGSVQWNFDQKLIYSQTQKLLSRQNSIWSKIFSKQEGDYPMLSLLKKQRYTEFDRIDRGYWPKFPYFSKDPKTSNFISENELLMSKKDSHLLRPGDTSPNFEMLLEFASALFRNHKRIFGNFNQNVSYFEEWIKKYHNEWMDLKRNSNI